MPGSFPALSTGNSFRYPVRRKINTRGKAHRFCDFSEQRYKCGTSAVLTDFGFVWNSISTADMEIIRAFYRAQDGTTAMDWSMIFDSVYYVNCQFTTLWKAECIGPQLWRVTLGVRVGPGVRTGIPANQSGAKLTSASISVIASWTPDSTGYGEPMIQGVYGPVHIGSFVSNSDPHFDFSAPGGSPSTLTYNVPTADLGNFYNLSIVAYAAGTLGATDFTPHPSYLKIYDVSVTATYADASTATIRPLSTSQRSGDGFGYVYGGTQGIVTNAGAAIDSDPATYAQIMRDYYGGLANAGYLQVSSFLFPSSPLPSTT